MLGFWLIIHDTDSKEVSCCIRIWCDSTSILRKLLFRNCSGYIFNSQHTILHSIFHDCIVHTSASIVKSIGQMLGKILCQFIVHRFVFCKTYNFCCRNILIFFGSRMYCDTVIIAFTTNDTT